MLQSVFGVPMPAFSTQPLPPALVAALAQRISAATAAVSAGAPVALAASVRQDAQRYLGARRRGELRLPGTAAARACDEGAHALMRLTVDAPPVGAAERLVA